MIKSWAEVQGHVKLLTIQKQRCFSDEVRLEVHVFYEVPSTLKVTPPSIPISVDVAELIWDTCSVIPFCQWHTLLGVKRSKSIYILFTCLERGAKTESVAESMLDMQDKQVQCVNHVKPTKQWCTMGSRINPNFFFFFYIMRLCNLGHSCVKKSVEPSRIVWSWSCCSF